MFAENGVDCSVLMFDTDLVRRGNCVTFFSCSSLQSGRGKLLANSATGSLCVQILGWHEMVRNLSVESASHSSVDGSFPLGFPPCFFHEVLG